MVADDMGHPNPNPIEARCRILVAVLRERIEPLIAARNNTNRHQKDREKNDTCLQRY